MYYLLLAIVAVLMSGCKSSVEDLIGDEFRKYVRENFDDPKSFKEVVSIEPVDTLSNEKVIKLLTSSLDGAKETNVTLDSLHTLPMADEDFKAKIITLNATDRYAVEKVLTALVSASVFSINENMEMESLIMKMNHVVANPDSLPQYNRITYKIKYRVKNGDALVLNELFAVVDKTKEEDNIEIRSNTLRVSESPEHITNIFKYLERYMELYKEKSEKYLDEFKCYKELKEMQ